MSALHDAARRVVAAWVGASRTWVEECNAAVMALDAALKTQPEPAQEHTPVAAAFSAAFGAERHSTDQRIVIERRGETLYLNGQEIGPGTLEIRRDGATYRAAERVAVQPEPTQEPVAWMVYTEDGKSVCVTDNPADFAGEHRALPLYTAPPQRPPLTDEEIDALFHDWNSHCYGDPVKSHRRFARAVERKVRGEKE